MSEHEHWPEYLQNELAFASRHEPTYICCSRCAHLAGAARGRLLCKDRREKIVNAKLHAARHFLDCGFYCKHGGKAAAEIGLPPLEELVGQWLHNGCYDKEERLIACTDVIST